MVKNNNKINKSNWREVKHKGLPLTFQNIFPACFFREGGAEGAKPYFLSDMRGQNYPNLGST